MGLRGVLLDVDGTLVDSNDAHARAWVEALREHGVDVDASRLRQLIGMGGDNLLPAIAGIERESPLGEQVNVRRGEIFRERFLPHLEAFPGARELVERLRGAGLSVAAASSAPPEELEPLLRIAGAEDLLDARTSAGEVESSKPDPDVITAALRKLGCAPEEALLVGDTPWDVAAARRAGTGTVAVRCGGFSDQDLAGAVAFYDDPADLVRRFDASPFAAATRAGRNGDG